MRYRKKVHTSTTCIQFHTRGTEHHEWQNTSVLARHSRSPKNLDTYPWKNHRVFKINSFEMNYKATTCSILFVMLR
ncbi:hypothetical protein M8J77_012527 [Diaphorina citri]|nr:hypothetical protein M8J77_012527 [Diaphorina citri]